MLERSFNAIRNASTDLVLVPEMARSWASVVPFYSQIHRHHVPGIIVVWCLMFHDHYAVEGWWGSKREWGMRWRNVWLCPILTLDYPNLPRYTQTYPDLPWDFRINKINRPGRESLMTSRIFRGVRRNTIESRLVHHAHHAHTKFWVDLFERCGGWQKQWSRISSIRAPLQRATVVSLR